MAGLDQAGGAAKGSPGDRLGAFDALFEPDSVAPTHQPTPPPATSKRQAKIDTGKGKPKKLAKSKDPQRTSRIFYLPESQSYQLDAVVNTLKQGGCDVDRSDLCELGLYLVLQQLTDVQPDGAAAALKKLQKKAQPPA